MDSQSVKITKGQLVLRRWDRDGLAESVVHFRTLEDLFAFCLTVREPYVIERIHIDGTDDQQTAQSITFTFQSITVHTSTKNSG